ncbi:MAG: nitrate/sulfonate/bicarbonate ABC transporter ATP-binding protein [Acidobacteriaceae bacterium]|nr:nitrate/sulfonate/bicarbonate ABC transporter ATP-binding protein [Acidobacteriaceae bacterium]
MDYLERLQFLDTLPEGAWQQLVAELSEKEDARGVPLQEPFGSPIIEARQIEKRFERGGQHHASAQIQVIAPTNLSVYPGKILALLGPSGSGKSTLLRMLCGLTAPSSGEVLWHGQPVRQAAPNVGIVFQSFALFPWLTVIDNVEVPLLARGMPHADRHSRALKTLDVVGLRGFEQAYPKELSGGMKQRVGFARALAVEPEILFMDEPFSALDVLTAENLRGELMGLWLEKKMPTDSIFLVTHNIEEAVLMADRVIVLGRNPARIRADFGVSLAHPRERNSAEFVAYVDYIYKLMTQPELEAAPPANRGVKVAYRALPQAGWGAIAGLLELLSDRTGGREDLYRMADDLRLEVDDLLPIVDAAVLLRFVKSERGDVELTSDGKAFADGDISERKALFRHAVLGNIPLFQQIQNALASKSDHTIPLEFFRDILQQHLSEDVSKQIDVALNWGRYGDVFTYDSETDRLLLNAASTATQPVSASTLNNG